MVSRWVRSMVSASVMLYALLACIASADGEMDVGKWRSEDVPRCSIAVKRCVMEVARCVRSGVSSVSSGNGEENGLMSE